MPEKLSVKERGAWSVLHQHQHRQRNSTFVRCRGTDVARPGDCATLKHV